MDTAQTWHLGITQTNMLAMRGGSWKDFWTNGGKWWRPKTTSKLRDLHNQLDLVNEIKSRRLGKLKNLVRIQVAREGREDLGKVCSVMCRMTLDMRGSEDGGWRISWHSSGTWLSERLRSNTNLNDMEWMNTKVWSWWPNFNRHNRSSSTNKGLSSDNKRLSHFNLWVMVLALKECKAWPAGPCYYSNTTEG